MIPEFPLALLWAHSLSRIKIGAGQQILPTIKTTFLRRFAELSSPRTFVSVPIYGKNYIVDFTLGVLLHAVK